MIRIGILSEDNASTEAIKLIQQFEDFKITRVARVIDDKSTKDHQYTTEELVNNSDASYIQVINPSVDLIQMGIKKSNHLFLRNVPNLTLTEIKQLSNLQDEAGKIIQFFNPYVFLTDNLKLQEQLKSPKLINIRLPLLSDQVEAQLVDLILFLTIAEKSEFKKIDVLGFQGKKNSSLINIRIVFSTGSIAQIHLHKMSSPNQSLIEVFQKDEKYVSLQAHQSQHEILKTEQNALRNFIKAIQQKPSISISLNELEQTLFILNEIKEKLKYSGYLLLR